MNNVELIGRIATDIKAGNGVVSSLLAVHRIYKSKDGEDSDFIPLSIFGKQADNFSKMVSKGEMIGIDGQIKTSVYADQNGEKKYGWSVAVDHFYLLNGSKHEGQHKMSQQTISDDNTYKVDSQLDNLDKILDSVKADEQSAKQSAKPADETKPAKQQVEQQADESISPTMPLGNGSKNNRSHISGNDFSKSVIDNQPSIEQLQQEIKDLKSKALPF